jgi:biotin transport system substrate-specific component
MLLYLVFGLLDTNAFAAASRGGPVLFVPTAGYLVGFVLAAATMGWARDKKFSNSALFASLVAANVLIFLCGMLGLMIIVSMTLQEAWLKGVWQAPFLAGGALKLAAAYLVLISYRSISTTKT